MQDDGDRRALFLGGLVTAFKAACWAVENDFGHLNSGSYFSALIPAQCSKLT
jgi:hypothetical protein